MALTKGDRGRERTYLIIVSCLWCRYADLNNKFMSTQEKVDAEKKETARKVSILCENLFNLKTNFKAILATLERIFRLFSLKWPKSP